MSGKASCCHRGRCSCSRSKRRRRAHRGESTGASVGMPGIHDPSRTKPKTSCHTDHPMSFGKSTHLPLPKTTLDYTLAQQGQQSSFRSWSVQKAVFLAWSVQLGWRTWIGLPVKRSARSKPRCRRSTHACSHRSRHTAALRDRVTLSKPSAGNGRA